MQLMPATAKRLRVTDRCNLDQNVSGGVRYLAWLMRRFHNDLRLVAGAYYAGEDTISRRGFAYRNSDVVAYVSTIRTTYLREAGIESESMNTARKRDVRMNKCLSLVHLITICFVPFHMASAQTELPQARIVNLSVGV
jgi:soluble lytic murein transglycosylase-like protein